MDVVFEVSPLKAGGPQSWVCDIARALRERGVGVRVLAFEFAPHSERVMAERLQKDEIAYRQIVLRGTWREKWRTIGREMEDAANCDVAHFNSDVVSGLFLRFAKRLRIPVRIFHARTPYWGVLGRGLRNHLYHWYFRWHAVHSCTHAFGVTREALAAVVGRSRRRLPCGVVPSAIRSSRFSGLIGERAARRRAARTLTLGFVGRLAASKNPRFVIEVLSRLRREGAAADALFMGAGPEEEAVRALALHRGVDRQVTFLPPDAQVGDIMARRMDVLLLPSEAGFEGTPRVTIEAQACGVPVICSTGIPEDVRVVPELFHRLRVSDGCEAWAEKALELGGIRVSPDHVSACFAESPLEISNQADQLIDQYQRFLQASQTAGPGNERTP